MRNLGALNFFGLMVALALKHDGLKESIKPETVRVKFSTVEFENELGEEMVLTIAYK